MRPFAEPPFFVANPLQANALARLRHAVTFPGGVALLSGGPGVGKSAFIRQALALVQGEVRATGRRPAQCRAAELHPAIAEGLGADLCAKALLARRTSGRQLILSLDVSGLNVDLARRLLRFLHLAGEQQTPVSLILEGPHTLHPLMDAPALIQLRQRLSFRLKLRPLTLLETAGYLHHCLAACDVAPEGLLAVNAPASVYQFVAGVPRLINTLMDATLGEAQARQVGKIDADLVRQVAEQLGWKPMGALGPADLASMRPAPVTRRTTDRVVPRSPVPETRSGRPRAGCRRTHCHGCAAHCRTPHGPETARSPLPVPMDDIDTGATGMIRLEDLDERFAETLFSEDSGHFKVLVEAGKPA